MCLSAPFPEIDRFPKSTFSFLFAVPMNRFSSLTQFLDELRTQQILEIIIEQNKNFSRKTEDLMAPCGLLKQNTRMVAVSCNYQSSTVMMS